MLGISKKVERVRSSLHDALVAKAKELIEEKPEQWQARAITLLDIADIVRRLTIEPQEILEHQS